MIAGDRPFGNSIEALLGVRVFLTELKIMNAYTDLEQSKKLAEFLPLESADMCYPKDEFEYNYAKEPVCHYSGIGLAHPCWSLAALLDVLPKGTRLLKSATDDIYHCDCPKCNIDEWFNNPIDACIEMIVKLKENELL